MLILIPIIIFNRELLWKPFTNKRLINIRLNATMSRLKKYIYIWELHRRRNVEWNMHGHVKQGLHECMSSRQCKRVGTSTSHFIHELTKVCVCVFKLCCLSRVAMELCIVSVWMCVCEQGHVCFQSGGGVCLLMHMRLQTAWSGTRPALWALQPHTS